MQSAVLRSSCSQKGIEELRKYQEHMEMRHPEGDFVLSEASMKVRYLPFCTPHLFQVLTGEWGMLRERSIVGQGSPAGCRQERDKNPARPIGPSGPTPSRHHLTHYRAACACPWRWRQIRQQHLIRCGMDLSRVAVDRSNFLLYKR
ncbi:hypothetical protein BGW80DRAFT_1379520 [Lactifluus volemus]|nr:hypothetical protein BGW80DRAFT_1379520 [Lactifluus volemus]